MIDSRRSAESLNHEVKKLDRIHVKKVVQMRSKVRSCSVLFDRG
jgi:hypothetical protein